jgi:hypothetical protein
MARTINFRGKSVMQAVLNGLHYITTDPDEKRDSRVATSTFELIRSHFAVEDPYVALAACGRQTE